jgi:hypothetical protein
MNWQLDKHPLITITQTYTCMFNITFTLMVQQFSNSYTTTLLHLQFLGLLLLLESSQVIFELSVHI